MKIILSWNLPFAIFSIETVIVSLSFLKASSTSFIFLRQSRGSFVRNDILLALIQPGWMAYIIWQYATPSESD